MKQLKNKTVLITGGGSGIGKIMTRLCLERGAKVIIWDINQKNIDDTLSAFSSQGEVYGFQVDVSNYENIQDVAKRVKNEVGRVWRGGVYSNRSMGCLEGSRQGDTRLGNRGRGGSGNGSRGYTPFKAAVITFCCCCVRLWRLTVMSDAHKGCLVRR